jgi:hypothetical protein
MSLGPDHAATITAAAGVRRVPSQDHHLAADRNGQAANNPAHPAKQTLIPDREHNRPQRRSSGSIPPAPIADYQWCRSSADSGRV